MFSTSSSLVFLLSARMTLAEFVDISKELNEVDKRNLKNFFINEGTDYEIMHFFVRGSFPQNRYDPITEPKLYEELKSDIRKDFISLKEFIDIETIKSVITEVGPISSSGLSSSAIIVEFIAGGNINLAERTKEEWKKKAGEVWAKIGKLPLAIFTKLKDSAEKGKIHNITTSIRTHKKGLYLMGAALALTLMTLAAYRIYQNKLRPAAKACKQYTGPEKANCIRKFTLEAEKAKLDALRAGVSACSNTAEPEKCRSVLDKKIKKSEVRISRLSKEV